ncbi:DUF4233 domain-containing protein [Streptomyces xiaopingdaonensis]|uniref:DUF4233 domain-containing protein n=1 Tax=Streptomyces xiaopingdaonensis TaxID=1565415 RepID=UPI000304DB68|nr:DUF4233 domain-containing protein [Streptomyces xiaopingdaonensis]
MRTLCASTLIGEFFVIGFAGLVAMQLGAASTGTVWLVSGVAMAFCVVLCGMLGRPAAVPAGWVLQAVLVAGGFVLPTMFFLGACFAGLWWASVHFGQKIDEAKARFAAEPDAA